MMVVMTALCLRGRERMDKIIIEGGKRLEGELEISGAKNAILPVMAAMILTTGENKISRVPRVRDVNTMLHLLNELGGRTEEFEGDRIIFDTADINNFTEWISAQT